MLALTPVPSCWIAACASMEHYAATGWGLCAEHQKLADDGFATLIECDSQRSGSPAVGANVKPAQIYRTGRVAHLKHEVFARVFNMPITANQPFVFVESGVIERYQSMVAPAAN